MYLVEQNSLISSLVPGSCLPNSLAGKARTSKPWLLVFLVDRLEILVLRCQTALAGGIDDQEDLTLVAGQVDILAFNVLDVKIKDRGRFLDGISGLNDRQRGNRPQERPGQPENGNKHNRLNTVRALLREDNGGGTRSPAAPGFITRRTRPAGSCEPRRNRDSSALIVNDACRESENSRDRLTPMSGLRPENGQRDVETPADVSVTRECVPTV